MNTKTVRILLRRKLVPLHFCILLLLCLLAAMPSPAQEPPDGKMHITLSGPNTYTLSVATDSLWEYQMEASDDLEYWQPLDSIFLPGDGGVYSQRVIVPQGAIKAFFRYRLQERAGGASGNTLTDWDRIYSFNANTYLDTDGDGIPDYLERSLATNPYDNLSFPWQVVRVDPFDNQAGHPRDGAIVVYLNRPLPASIVTVPANFVRQLSYFQLPGTTLDLLDFATVAPGSAMILPGRKAVAFLPSPALAAGSNHTVVNNYRIDFSTAVTGIAQLIPWHSEFSTVDTFDDVGSWVKMVRPGETAIEVATDFAPVIDWSQPLHPTTVVSGNVTVAEQVSGTPVAVTVYFDYDTNRMALQHTTPFQPDTTYTVTLGTGFTNLMGKPLLNAFTWSFRTRPLRSLPVAGQGPYVTAVVPGDFSTSVDTMSTAQITLTFSEAMDASTLTAATVHLRQHGVGTDVTGAFAYNSSTKTLTFTPDASLTFATRYELTLDVPRILSTATTPQPLQAQAQFVFTTAPDSSQSGGGGMGGAGSGPGGTNGTPDPDQPEPLILQISYGDPDRDAGASVKLSITLPEGSQREQQMPNATNDYATRMSPEIPDGSTVEITPQFLKGNDPDYDEELSEVQVEVAGLSLPAGTNYYVFKQGTAGASASPAASGGWEVQGPLPNGTFTALVQNGEKLAVVPLEITISRQGAAAPDPKLVVKLGDTVTISLLRGNPLGLTFAPGQVVWKYRQLKPDGTYTNWTDFGPSATGAQFDYQTTTAGIFQVEAYFANDPTHTVPYLRQKDDPKTAGGVPLGLGKRGEPNAFGVCSSQIQIDLCFSAESWMGSTAYDKQTGVTAQYGFSAFPAGKDTCNMFVAHMGCSVGATVPVINGVLHSYPPVANQWAGTLSTDIVPGAPFSSAIRKWYLLPATFNPEPGFTISHPSATPTGEGHCAIIDYDGFGIGAGTSGTVNRNYNLFYDGTSRYRTYVEGLPYP